MRITLSKIPLKVLDLDDQEDIVPHYGKHYLSLAGTVRTEEYGAHIGCMDLLDKAAPRAIQIAKLITQAITLADGPIPEAHRNRAQRIQR